MGLRQRVKSRIKTFFRPLSAPAGKTPPSARAAGSVAPSTAPPPAAAAVPPPARPQEPPAPPAPEAPLRPAPVAAASPPSAPPSEPSADDVAAKAARHLARTRLAVLRFIDEKGGKAGLAEMHDYSERRYFIAHKKFSDLMESLLDDDLILFDHARGEATLTAQGRAAIGKETAAAAR